MTTETRASVLRWAAPALLLMVALLLITQGFGEPGAGAVVRWTARTSLVFFCAGFASWGLASTSWPVRHRPGLLAALALSHGLHLLAIGALAWHTGGANLAERGALPRLLGGMLAYAAIFLAAWRPGGGWARWGSFWVWTVFLVSYLPRAMDAPAPFGLAVALLAAAMAVRLWGARRAGRSSARIDDHQRLAG
jgi:methionine sulfoxide reductase heme-binding subunit